MKHYIIEKQGDKWILWSKNKSKKLGTFDSKEEAVKRERQILWWKTHHELDDDDTVIRELTSDLMTIADVDVFAIGRWRGVNSPAEGDRYEKSHLESMVEAFKAGIVQPKLKITHGDDKDQPNIGDVSNLRVVGNKLVADFVNVPKALYEFMKQTGAFARRSAEIMWNMKDSAGKTWSRVLKAVALLAPGQKPAVTALSDGYQFEALYCYEMVEELRAVAHQATAGDLKHKDPTQEGGDDMDEATKKLLKKHNVETIEELDAAIEAERNKVESYEQDKIRIRAESDRQFLDSLKKDGKLIPAIEPYAVALFEAVRDLESEHEYELNGEKKKDTPGNMLKALFSAMPKLVDFKEQSRKGKEHQTEGDATAKVDRLAKGYMNDGKAKDYNAALEMVRNSHPEEWKAYTERKKAE